MSSSAPDARREWQAGEEESREELTAMREALEAEGVAGEGEAGGGVAGRGEAGGGGELGFLGGEPTLHPALPRLVGAARELGFGEVSLCTNGVLLARQERLSGLLKAGVTRVTVSVHSHQAAVEDALTGRLGSWDKKVAAIQNLVLAHHDGALASPVAINVVVHKKNYRVSRQLVAHFAALGVKEIRFNALRPEGRGREARRYFVRYKTSAPHLLDAVLSGWELGARVTCGGFPPCVWPPKVRLRPRLVERLWADAGEPTRMVSEHNALGGAQRFSWDEMRTQRLKVKAEKCRTCALEPRCEGVWASYISLHGWDEFDPI